MTGLTLHIQSKTYPDHSGQGTHEVISDLNLEVGDGSFVCLVGPSGCGKTTLLNIIAGLDHAFDGAIERKGGGTLGFVFQEPRLLPWLTVRENIELVLREGGTQTAALEALFDTLHLRTIENAFPARLSLGMARRVSLARALAVEPGVLLLDEPFVSLDKPTAERLRGVLLDGWRARRTSVLMVTHDLDEALQLADRIVFLSRSPTRAVLDWPVPSPRADADTVRHMKQSLLDAHPELLSGLGGQEPGTD